MSDKETPIPVLGLTEIPGDPTVAELQAHARALGMRVHIILCPLDMGPAEENVDAPRCDKLTDPCDRLLCEQQRGHTGPCTFSTSSTIATA